VASYIGMILANTPLEGGSGDARSRAGSGVFHFLVVTAPIGIDQTRLGELWLCGPSLVS
jgi:hypothetical protein